MIELTEEQAAALAGHSAPLQFVNPRTREVFVLVHLEEQSVAETAAMLGKAIGTVKSHLHRALESLRHELADLSKEGRER